ncbi:MAG: S8 family serine peptidase [Pseudomonadota bacterium]
MKTLFRRAVARAACVLALVSAGAMAGLPLHGSERGPVRRPVPVATAESEARVIVKYKADAALMHALSARAVVLPQHAQALSVRLGLSLIDGRTIGARAQVLKATGLSSRELADRLAAQADVEYAVVDGRQYALAAPNDPLYPASPATSPAVGQWYLRAPTSTAIVDATSVVSAINAQAAWDITTGNPGVVVAMLDTGVRFDHPDLAAKLLPGYDFVSDSRNANDGDARDADPSDPGDYVTSADIGVVPGCTAGTAVADSSWHGTQTAGLIGAATNNGVGMAGVGRDVMLLPVRVLGKCGGYDSDIQAGMLWAAGLSSTPTSNRDRARVVNLSLGSTGACSLAYQDVIRQLNAAGVVVVVAAGNEGLAVGTPANCPGAIAVAGVRHAGTKVGYSDLGPEVAIAAPAGNCLNTTGPCLFPLLTASNSGTTTPVAGAAGAIYTGGGSDASLGTSFSAPLVSGTVGLMFSANPSLTPAQVLVALQSTARTFPATGFDPAVKACAAPTSTAQDKECYCTTGTCGAGLLDAGAATATAAAIHASVSASATSVAAGTTVTLDGSGSWPSGGANASLTYQWALSGDVGVGSLTDSSSSTAAVQTVAPGNIVVTLTVTDSTGQQARRSVTLNVVAAPAPRSSGGGGGAMDVAWLLGWLASVIGVRRVTPRRR